VVARSISVTAKDALPRQLVCGTMDWCVALGAVSTFKRALGDLVACVGAVCLVGTHEALAEQRHSYRRQTAAQLCD
jgi:hypothetical protein